MYLNVMYSLIENKIDRGGHPFFWYTITLKISH